MAERDGASRPSQLMRTTSALAAAPASGSGGLIDERDFDAVLERQVTQARHNGGALSLVVLEFVGSARSRNVLLTDYDWFRDAIELVRARVRDVDVIARHGKDQLAIIVPGLDSREVASFAAETQETLELHRFGLTGHTIPVFIGVAVLEPHFTHGRELLAATQKNLSLVMRAHPIRVWDTQAHFEADHGIIRQQERDACIVVIHGAELGRRYDIEGREMTIGRAMECDICVDQDSVSLTHATLTTDGTGVRIRDNQSSSGTYVNDDEIHEASLKDGDLVKVGRSIFKFLTGDNIESSYHEEKYRLSTLDGLTQIFNKSYFTDALERELSRARRYDRPLSLMMLDIDELERCNETFGHRAGDHVLRHVAEIARDRSRKIDVVARYGGDELAIIIPELELHGAAELAESIRAQIAQARFVFDEQTIAVTLSVGVAELEPHITTAADLVGVAAARLAHAKDSGRDRVVVSDVDDEIILRG